MGRPAQSGQALIELITSLLVVLGFFFFAYAWSSTLEQTEARHRFKTERRQR